MSKFHEDFDDYNTSEQLSAAEKAGIIVRALAAFAATLALHSGQVAGVLATEKKPILPAITCSEPFTDTSPPTGEFVKNYTQSLIDSGVTEGGTQLALTGAIIAVNPQVVRLDLATSEYKIVDDATAITAFSKCTNPMTAIPQS